MQQNIRNIVYIIILENGIEILCVPHKESDITTLELVHSFIFARQYEELMNLKNITILEWLDMKDRNKYQWKLVMHTIKDSVKHE